MPTELEEVSISIHTEYIYHSTTDQPKQLVGFIASPNPQIRKLAIENLVPYSTAEPSVFKDGELTPVKNLKILIRDHPVYIHSREAS